jgi:hypothetical protein
LLSAGRYASLHIAFDTTFSRFSPGVLLTAYELERAYGRTDMEEYDFLGGFLENKTTWTDKLRPTQQLFVYRRDFLFSVLFFWHFRVEPALKRALKRAGLHRLIVSMVRVPGRLLVNKLEDVR